MRQSLQCGRGLVLAACLATLASAACECGYYYNSTSTAGITSRQVWTDAFETDFLHAPKINGDMGWRPQVYTVPSEKARGTFGKDAALENVIANPLKDNKTWTGEGANGGDAGAQLLVRSQLKGDAIPMAEIVGIRDDMLYGSFRVSMKINDIPGSCAAFFFYHNDTQEIDIEFLTREFNETSNLINLISQSPASADAGFDASGTPGFKTYNLPFKPYEGFHEYRFDWSPGLITYYADNQKLYELTVDVPDSPGHLVLNHWSNGDPKWSGGPPTADSTMTVSYVKAYFNSSNPDAGSQFDKRCPDPGDVSKICGIPDQNTPPPDASQGGDTGAQTTFLTSAAGRRSPVGWSLWSVAIFSAVVFSTC
ncbi:glycoside hydrolase family 16 protein [Eremomyces bilateralis CBS 781.70]|uniref:Glycoside hydrolase family 16 protein n=1 Tax=Eremomyces bilateralis CBS 781.70 TaxID=1392243 RepID=A0A6G1GAV7_9PEZI|nr:glycoside hydrolase family 16 protein [Eremomyces bilateralis CBS 781.70]KAF1815218.1 glycoside hydrolase family 16 protein [Eremomyces bilateralis CBS 781.70]